MVLLERPDLGQQAVEPAAALRVADVALAGVFDLGVGDARRRHGVVVGDVDLANRAAHVDVVLFVAGHDDLRAFDDEIAARQHVDHVHGQGRRDLALALDRAVAGEVDVARRREQRRRIDARVLLLERRDHAERRRQAVAGRVGFLERGVGLMAREIFFVDLDHEDVADAARDRIFEQPGRALGVQAAEVRGSAVAVLALLEHAMLGLVGCDVAGTACQRDHDEREFHGASPTTTTPADIMVPWTTVWLNARRTVAGSPVRAASSSTPEPLMWSPPRTISTWTCEPRGIGGRSARSCAPIGVPASRSSSTVAPMTWTSGAGMPANARCSTATSSSVSTVPAATAWTSA